MNECVGRRPLRPLLLLKLEKVKEASMCMGLKKASLDRDHIRHVHNRILSPQNPQDPNRV